MKEIAALSLHTLEPNPSAVRAIRDADLARLVEIYPELPKVLGRCLTCHGREVFRWRDEDGELAEYACPCAEQLLLHLWLLNAGLDLRYQKLSWSDATGVDERVVGAVMDYADNAESYASNGIGMVLHGMRGNGKTMIATLLLKKLMASGYDGFFTTFQGLLDLYTKSWGKGAPEHQEWFDRRVKNAGVLIVDDMGREHGGRLQVAEAAFDDVLRTRVMGDRPTILTSNRSIKELGELYSLNALSLLDEVSLVVEFGGEDYRPRQREIRITEAQLQLTRPIVVA